MDNPKKPIFWALLIFLALYIFSFFSVLLSSGLINV